MGKKAKSLDYDSKDKFNSYWHQIDEIKSLEPESILEVGIGTKFVSDYLEKHGFDVTTLDINKEIYERHSPDIVGDIANLPFKSESFDVVTAYEVLEHIPFKKFDKILAELYEVSSDYVIISLPDVSFYLKLNLESIKFLNWKKLISFPLNKYAFKLGVDKIFEETADPNVSSHNWEIGRKGFSIEKIKRKIKEQGFKIKKNYRVYENPYHKFFLLRKY